MEELVVKVNNFEGPFDLLLNLIEKKKMMISDINISQLIDEYLEVLKLSERENIEIKSDFIIIASELIEIKTLNLLNLDSDKEKETNLKRRLEEHKLFKELTPKVANLEKEFNISYSRGESKRTIKKIAKDYDLTSLTTDDIFDVYKKYFDSVDMSEFMELNLIKQYDIKEIMDNILIKIYFKNWLIDDLFLEAENKLHLIYIFLAILELYKDAKINIDDGEIRKC
ncbi:MULTISPECIES: segregation and condensation protein A [Fusobacterium]|jgi:scpA/B protein|uniref:Segregation and condensation protein A n=3 Tax=Fusobacterium TaxID=848 RepID=A0AAD0HTI8_9FUSO|nr:MULTISPECIES: ScpA family protein [Fusobacterium]ATV60267.1 segregation/condensation protein A [Fusobacterium pseudoperiodonticum]AVQ24657.1 segregation/condensation protein A [Fusobacterium periodonticum]KGE63172.1 segregation and condensation protein A [Fusobacterium periodonticum 2_1_31]MBF1197077.1 segregation/condensation protein A [Fusobacterium periodonticum]MBF1198546.1 segregation/condensation protein A [Fusobacterium periodonticum]